MTKVEFKKVDDESLTAFFSAIGASDVRSAKVGYSDHVEFSVGGRRYILQGISNLHVFDPEKSTTDAFAV